MKGPHLIAIEILICIVFSVLPLLFPLWLVAQLLLCWMVDQILQILHTYTHGYCYFSKGGGGGAGGEFSHMILFVSIYFM